MKKFAKLHLNIKMQKISKYLYFLSAILILACLFFTYTFLYENFYLSITRAREVVVLKEKVAPETININAFNNIIEGIKEKSKNKNSTIYFNPFE